MSKWLMVCLTLFCSSTMAAYQNGNKLKTDMNSDGTYGKSFAMGYIVGTTEVLEDWGKVCVANGVTQGQLTDVVRKYFDDNPESLHKPAYMLVYFALRKVWPCKTESVPPENNQAPSAPPKPKQPRKQSEDSPF